MRLTDYLTEVKKKKPKKKGIPKAKGKKYSFAIKNDPDDWYQKPEMMGHRWAIESLDKVEEIINTYSKTKLQKWVISQVWGTPEELKKTKYTWHTFATNYTKKDAMLLQFTLRRVDKYKKNMADLLNDVSNKTGVLKSELIWALEHLSYTLDKEKYKEQYIRSMGWYGMSPEDADKRFEEYHKKQSGKRVTAYK